MYIAIHRGWYSSYQACPVTIEGINEDEHAADPAAGEGDGAPADPPNFKLERDCRGKNALHVALKFIGCPNSMALASGVLKLSAVLEETHGTMLQDQRTGWGSVRWWKRMATGQAQNRIALFGVLFVREDVIDIGLIQAPSMVNQPRLRSEGTADAIADALWSAARSMVGLWTLLVWMYEQPPHFPRANRHGERV